MNKIETNVVGTEDARARALVAAANLLLGDRVPAELLARLFGRAAPEDLVRYSPAELAQLAANTWMFMAERAQHTPKIRVVAPPLEAGGELKRISVLELINDDKPFLLDSVMGELTERGIDVRLVAHPVFTVERQDDGRLVGIANIAADAAHRESIIHIHIERIDEEHKRADLVAALGEVLADVGCAVADWRAMVARIAGVAAELKASPPPLPVEEIAEAIQFLEWLALDNFVILGVRADSYDRHARTLASGE